MAKEKTAMPHEVTEAVDSLLLISVLCENLAKSLVKHFLLQNKEDHK